MCEIQFVYKYGENLKKDDINKFVLLMKGGCLSGNDDAFGLFNHNYMFKSSGAFKKKKILLPKLETDFFVIGHNRLSTKGTENNNQNNHPFKYKNFIIVHNGIISNELYLRKKYHINKNIETDSFVIVWLIDYFFNKCPRKLTREEKVIISIKKTYHLLRGSLSVFVYDKRTKGIYYFKNYLTNFEILKKDNLIIGSTNTRNLSYVLEDLDEVKSFNLTDDKLYKISNKSLYVLAELDPAPFQEYSNYPSYYNGYGWSSGFYDFSKKSKEENTEFSDSEVEMELQERLNLSLGFTPEIHIGKEKICIGRSEVLDNFAGNLFTKFSISEKYIILEKGEFIQDLYDEKYN